MQIDYTAASGGTYYVFPASQSLADWTTYRVLMTEGSGADVGQYSSTVDSTYGYIWHIFEGATQPAWIDTVAVDDQSASVAALNADATQMQARADASTAANASALIKAEVEKIDRAAAPVTPGAPKKKRLVNAAGETLETVHEVLDGDA